MATDIKKATAEERKAAYKRMSTEMRDDSFFQKRELSYLPDIMNEGELLLAFTHGYIKLEPWLVALTDQRILLLSKGLVYGLMQNEFSLQNVSGVSYETGIIHSEIEIHVGNTSHTIFNLPKKSASLFAERVRKALHNIANQPVLVKSVMPDNVTHDNDLVGKLERLASLHERGILTDAEFAEQKAKLLNS